MYHAIFCIFHNYAHCSHTHHLVTICFFISACFRFFGDFVGNFICIHSCQVRSSGRPRIIEGSTLSHVAPYANAHTTKFASGSPFVVLIVFATIKVTYNHGTVHAMKTATLWRCILYSFMTWRSSSLYIVCRNSQSVRTVHSMCILLRVAVCFCEV
jgi:hypothetical protein